MWPLFSRLLSILLFRSKRLNVSLDVSLFVCRIWKKELLWTFTMRVAWCVGLTVGLR
jgi:hypothetical protein